MTIFAGIYCLDKGLEVPELLKISIGQHLRVGNNSTDLRDTLDVPGFFLECWDSGAFAESSWVLEHDDFAIKVAGDPLLTDKCNRPARSEQAMQIKRALDCRDHETLASCRGSFAFVSYDVRKHILNLTTDAIGLRSVYYLMQDGLLIFSTALRLLESIPEIRKSLSDQAMAELCAFSFPLAERTPYTEIKVLRESEILLAADGLMCLQRYDAWEISPTLHKSVEHFSEHLHHIFKEAVEIRAGKDTAVYSFLSGGMDSRSIVATLLQSGRRVEALNFSAIGSQDQLFAQRFSAEVSQQCRLHCLPGGIFPNFSFLALAAKTSLERTQPIAVNRPQFIWSGDGGSVGLGHVYMDEPMLDIAESKGIDAAANYFLRFNRVGLPVGILSRRARGHLPRQLLDAVVQEMNLHPCADLGRRIYLFLLFNDQRRHLFKHFETIDQHGLELLTPFYDSKFLKAVAATPSRWGVLHRLYSKWFEFLPSFARTTPWQTYPGHVSCPVMMAGDTGSYQWANSEVCRNGTQRERFRLAQEIVRGYRSANSLNILSPSRVWLSAGLHALGLRNCQHVLSVIQTYARHAERVTTI